MTRDQLLEECFGRSDFPPPVRVFEMLDERTGDVLSHVDLYLRRVKIRLVPDAAVAISEGATTLTVAGLAQVCTDPAFRGRGYASALVRSAGLWVLEHRSLKFAALFGDPDFYERLGYSHPEGATDERFLVRELGDERWPAGRLTPLGEW